ncbi:MAG: glycosyltransferase family 9 protein [Planctomycetota bacterium]
MKAPTRILLIRPSALGDVCRSVPLVASLRAQWPDTPIDWLVNAPFLDAVRAHPAVDRAVPFDRSRVGRSPRALKQLGAALAEAGYSIVIDAQGLARSAALAALTRAPIRVGHADARELGWLALTHPVAQGASQHTVDRMLGLLAPLGVPPLIDMRLYAPPECQEAVEADTDLSGSPIVLAPTSIWPGKQWPIDRFTQLAHRLADEGIGPVVVVGTDAEKAECQQLLQGPVSDRMGRTSVGGLMALIERAACVVANDSAALHMAVGFDRPAVGLFGPTDVSRVGPYRRDADVIQASTPAEGVSHKDERAGRAMMEQISVDLVFKAVLARVGSTVAS